MSRTVFIIHTNRLAGEDLMRLFAEIAPDVTVRNIIDDSMLPEVLANGGVTPGVLRRYCTYVAQAEMAGADLIFNQCSSVGEAADIARSMVKVPLVKIDERMAEVACQTGSRIGVVATASSTMGPTVRLIMRTAARLGTETTITEVLCADAFERIVVGDKEGHNRIVLAAIRELMNTVDVVVCAQGSMLALQPELGETPVPVLMSPPIGIKHAADVLATLK